MENSTFWWGGPDPGIFHISKKKVVFKMHFKPFLIFSKILKNVPKFLKVMEIALFWAW